MIVQSDLLNATHPSLILAPVTGELRDLPGFRIPIAPTAENGLREPSEVMVDKLFAAPRDRIGRPIGHLDATARTRLDRVLAMVLGLA